ncbi:MAG: hypothetical protein RLZZ79_789 [Actinomycetota bacterium]
MSNPAISAEALILASGSDCPDADQILRRGLNPFIHEILKEERIDLAGRTIIGVLIRIDPAHFDAIYHDLEEIGKQSGLDVAMELN